jgi:hypothetical protein
MNAVVLLDQVTHLYAFRKFSLLMPSALGPFFLEHYFFLQNFKNKRGSGQVMFSEKVNEGERIMFYIANVSSE